MSRMVCGLLVATSVVFQPAGSMTTLRIVVRPVDHAALVVPLVLAIESNVIARPQCPDSRRQVDVMRDKQGAPLREFQDETLMSRAIVIIAQHPLHRAGRLDPLSRAPLLRGCAG